MKQTPEELLPASAETKETRGKRARRNQQGLPAPTAPWVGWCFALLLLPQETADIPPAPSVAGWRLCVVVLQCCNILQKNHEAAKPGETENGAHEGDEGGEGVGTASRDACQLVAPPPPQAVPLSF